MERPAERRAARKIRRSMVETLISREEEKALARIFRSDQLGRIADWCRTRGIDRHTVVAEIIEAGMLAKGLSPE
jgi:hypothetical protein